MKTKQVLEQIELMNDSLINELNSIVADMRNKSNKSDVQTIAKHLQELEEKVDKLENYIYAKENCNCNTNTRKSMESVMAILVGSGLDGFMPKTNPQPDYFLKAKNLLIEYAEKTMIKKGIEYTPAGDRFANFRPILGEKKTAIEKLIGYNAKHVQYCFMQETNMTAKTIDELLEHWGDVFNYNVLGLAMQSTDKPNSVVPYADRPTQEKEIKDIVDSAKNFTEYNSKLTNNGLYSQLLGCIKESNLNYIILLFAKQLERLENSK